MNLLTIYNSLLILSVLGLGLLSGCTAESPATNEKPVRPNIIYILADDLGYGDLGCYGQQRLRTPHIDRLAREGMRFTQHYSGSPVCAPARSVLLSGLHTGHTPVRGNAEVWPEGQQPIPATARLLPEYLGDHGYRTAAFGKWGLGYPGSEGAPERQGFDYFYGYNCQRTAHVYWPEHLWRNDQKVVLPANEGFRKRGTYAPQLIQEEVLDYLRATDEEQPFFLYYAHLIPHAELQAPDSLVAKYRGHFIPENAYAGWKPGEKKPKWGYTDQPEGHAAFAAMIEVLDEHVGEILDLLDSLGVADITIVAFSSDNGPHVEGGADPDYFDSNGPLRGYKRDLYEGGIRVPLLLRWPDRVAAASHSDHISGFQDLLPTFLELAGAPAPDSLDGISFLPTLAEEPERQKLHDYLYWEFSERGGRVALRQGPWKAIHYHLDQDSSRWQLYDLAADPGEQRNLATTYPDTLNKLIDIAKAARTESDQFPLVVW